MQCAKLRCPQTKCLRRGVRLFFFVIVVDHPKTVRSSLLDDRRMSFGMKTIDDVFITVPSRKRVGSEIVSFSFEIIYDYPFVLQTKTLRFPEIGTRCHFSRSTTIEMYTFATKHIFVFITVRFFMLQKFFKQNNLKLCLFYILRHETGYSCIPCE